MQYHQILLLLNHCYSNDFGAEVRDLFEVITNDSLSPQLVKRIIAFRFGMKDCSDDLDDFYSDFLLQQARYNVGIHCYCII